MKNKVKPSEFLSKPIENLLNGEHPTGELLSDLLRLELNGDVLIVTSASIIWPTEMWSLSPRERQPLGRALHKVRLCVDYTADYTVPFEALPGPVE